LRWVKRLSGNKKSFITERLLLYKEWYHLHPITENPPNHSSDNYELEIVNSRKIHMPKIDLKNIVWQEGTQFVAQCLNVDVSSFGDNREEALRNLQEALELYFEDSPIEEVQPVDNPEIVTTSLARA
jgi:predicted RNase H-like HicB family nuclease